MDQRKQGLGLNLAGSLKMLGKGPKRSKGEEMAKQKISGGNDPQGHHEFSLLVNLTGMMVTLSLNVDYTTGINKI